MKVEGIPAKLDVDVKHTHVVALKVEIDEETVENVVDGVQAIVAITVTAYAIKKTVDLVQRYGFEMVMKSVWKR